MPDVGIGDASSAEGAASGRDRLDAIHHEIRQRICLLEYPPGTRLSETALAEAFGTSRTPVRRVLARLEDAGLVQSRHGVGTLVTDSDIATLAEVYRLRVELTALTGTLDPVPPDAAFMARLDALVDEAAGMIATGTPHAFTRFDMAVFQTLLGLTGNAALRDTLERLYYQTKRIWLTAAIAAKIDIDAEFRVFHHELEAIRLALTTGDLVSAALIQRAHISMSFRRLIQQGS